MAVLTWLLIALVAGPTPCGPAPVPESCQSSGVSGHVIDAETNEGLPGVHVFYSGTMIGDVSDADGGFDLPSPPVDGIDLVFSMLGYETLILNLSPGETDRSDMTVRMAPAILELDIVDITAERDRDWEKKLKLFTYYFFSDTAFGKSCVLVNPEV